MSRLNGLVSRGMCVVVMLGIAGVARAAELAVPGDYPTIQAAVDAAVDGDEVVLAPGTYRGAGNRDVDLGGKAVTIRSEDPADPSVVAATVIDCEGTPSEPHVAVTLNCYWPEPVAQLAGLTITGADSAEGAVICDFQSQAVIRGCVIAGNTGSGVYARPFSLLEVADCRIEDNVTSQYGGGICLAAQCTATIERCVIRGNQAVAGGGLFSFESWPSLSSCLVSDNVATQQGGGLYWEDSGVRLAGCTVAANQAGLGGGLYGLSDNYVDRAEVRDTILWGNAAARGAQVALEVTAERLTIDTLAVAYSLVQGGRRAVAAPTGWSVQWLAGNLAVGANPRFADADGPDNDRATWQDNEYRLMGRSSCVNRADPAGSYDDLLDLDGQPRRSGPRADLGAYEYAPQAAALQVIDVLRLTRGHGKARLPR